MFSVSSTSVVSGLGVRIRRTVNANEYNVYLTSITGGVASEILVIAATSITTYKTATLVLQKQSVTSTSVTYSYLLVWNGSPVGLGTPGTINDTIVQPCIGTSGQGNVTIDFYKYSAQ